MVVQRGYPTPPSYHEPRLQNVAPEYFVEVIRRGKGHMPPYANRISARDQLAIAAYIRALQLSRAFPETALTPEDRAQLPREPR